MSKKYGYWETDGTEFVRKFDALIHAAAKKTEVYFKYHDELWKNFDRTKLGKIPLKQLYKDRAQMLRDQYDYLILYYSGGSDSHNVLRTFVDNGIKLDEVCVKWPKALMDGKLYTPNSVDTTARNYWSEWDYSVKPTLDWLKSNHPSIKITIKDYTENIDSINVQPIFEILNHVRAGAMLISGVTSDSVIVLSDQGKKVGNIYGVDKPLLTINDDNQVSMFFTDLALSMANGVDTPYYTDECFYWSPDYPILAFEMANIAAEYYNINKDARKFLRWSGNNTANLACSQYQNDTTKKICYDTWDFRFQADKPVSFNRTDKWFWFFEHSEISQIKNSFMSSLSSYTNLMSDVHVTKYTDGSAPSIKTIPSRGFYVRTLDV